MWPIRTMSFFGLFVVMCMLSVVHPLFGIVNYMMIYQVNPTTSWWGIPLADLNIRFSMLAALFLVLGMVLNWDRLPKVRPTLCLWQMLVMLLVFIAFVSRLIGLEVTDWPTQVVLEKFAKLMMFVLLLTHLMTTRRNFNVMLWILVVGSLILGHDAYTAPRWEFISGRLQSVGGPDFRASSGLAVHTAAMLPLIGVAAMTAKKWRWRILALASGAFTVNAMILCRTRSAFVALAVALVAAILLAPRGRRARVWAAVLVGGALSYTLTDSHYWTRMDTLRNDEYMEEDVAVSLRREIWQTAMVMIADQPQGVGCGNFPRVIGDYNWRVKHRGTHNTFIVCCAELGVHGLVVFLLIIFVTFVQLNDCRRLVDWSRAPPESRLIIYGITLSVLIYLVSGFFTERFYVESFWWVLAMPTCYLRALRREAEEAGMVPALATWISPGEEWTPEAVPEFG